MIFPSINFRHSIAPFAVVAAVIFFVIFVGTATQKSSAEESADKIIALCKNDSYRQGCYDREISKLMDRLTLEETFKVTSIVQDKDSGYPYCHVLGHLLGGVETAKDPSQWKEVAGRCPTNMCSNGCMHGVFQERFRAEALPDSSVNDVSTILGGICEPKNDWNTTLLEQATCTHALGHLTMYVTNANTRKSLLICNRISINKDGYDFRPLCYDGVFMQIFQPLEPEDFALIEGKVPDKNEVKKFCFSFLGEERNSCWSESWPLASDVLKEGPANAVSFCGKLSDAESQKKCLTDIFYIMAAQLNLDEKKITDYCGKGIGKVKGQCFAAAATRFLEVDSRNIKKTVRFCQTAETLGSGDACYRQLSSYASYNFSRGSKEFNNLCQSLPQKWRALCFSGRSSTI